MLAAVMLRVILGCSVGAGGLLSLSDVSVLGVDCGLAGAGLLVGDPSSSPPEVGAGFWGTESSSADGF